MERKCHENEQYSKIKSPETSGIPCSTDGITLEETVHNLFSKGNASVKSSNVEDCHLLKTTKNVPQEVIVILWKRKDVYRV